MFVLREDMQERKASGPGGAWDLVSYESIRAWGLRFGRIFANMPPDLYDGRLEASIPDRCGGSRRFPGLQVGCGMMNTSSMYHLSPSCGRRCLRHRYRGEVHCFAHSAPAGGTPACPCPAINGQAIYDAFLGSGTNLIAPKITGVCDGLESQPPFCRCDRATLAGHRARQCIKPAVNRSTRAPTARTTSIRSRTWRENHSS